VPQTQALTVHLTAWDQDGLSGVRTSSYKLDGGDGTQGTSVTVPAVTGYHIISYYSVDNAGNRESTRSCTVRTVIAAKVVHRGLLARRR
jgi:hypothetical protein